MKIIRGLHNLKPLRSGSVVTVGVFDGVHQGHRKVIAAVVRRARSRGLRSVVVTFDPHPMKVLLPRRAVPSLISLDHRLRLIEELGVDVVLVIRFTKAFARLPAATFAGTILAGKLGAREVVASDKFYFGRGGACGLTDLASFGRRYGFAVRSVSPARTGGTVVGSRAIRRLIAAGKLRHAAALLGRDVAILGTVVAGSRLARQLGYPTANVNPHHEVIPPSGVYAVRVIYAGRQWKGIVNIGTRPTFFSSRDAEPSIEVHIFGFTKDIYGKDLEILFIRRIRDERRFPNRQALVTAIRHDETMARRIL